MQRRVYRQKMQIGSVIRPFQTIDQRSSHQRCLSGVLAHVFIGSHQTDLHREMKR